MDGRTSRLAVLLLPTGSTAVADRARVIVVAVWRAADEVFLAAVGLVDIGADSVGCEVEASGWGPPTDTTGKRLNRADGGFEVGAGIGVVVVVGEWLTDRVRLLAGPREGRENESKGFVLGFGFVGELVAEWLCC